MRRLLPGFGLQVYVWAGRRGPATERQLSYDHDLSRLWIETASGAVAGFAVGS